MRDFKRILADQKQELEDRSQREKLIERENFSYFHTLASSNLIKVIIGVRRCGKSTLAAQLLGDFAYINFDDERLSSLKTEELDSLLEAAYQIYPEFKVLLLDEIQNIESWELFVNRLKRQGLNIIVTGSNANLLSKELATHLTGRHVTLELFPFSFKEFLKYKGIKIETETTKGISQVKKELSVYLTSGGFPETLTEVEPKTYLQSLYSTILLRDVLTRYKVRYVKTFKDLANYVLSNFSREISFNKLKKMFRLGSDHTAKNYLGFLEETYLIFLIEKFSYKKKESLLGPRKVYTIDTGLIKAVSFQFSEDRSHLYENVVALGLLRKKSVNPDLEIYYWKNQQQEEVDFLVREGLKVRQLIQVCCDLSREETKQRELRALFKASQELECKDLLVITEDYEAEETVEGKKIKYTPLWRWLLQ
ncbi:MAG: ATP-binding protein [Candidatus Woesearchaeota archaeon]